MNNRSMGTFLAELRKEKGITQRELAEILNVSDKTVSHWECDENSPDLSMIPIISDYFEISCDELIRGERKGKNSVCAKDVLTHSRDTVIAENSDNNIKNNNVTKISKAYSKHKIMCISSIFASAFLIAASMLIIKIVEMISYSKDFESIAFIFSMVFFPCLCVFITFVSRHIFINTLKDCQLQTEQFKGWKRKADAFCVLPLIFSAGIIFILVKMIIPSPAANLTSNELFTTIPASVEADISETVPYTDDEAIVSGTVSLF